MAEMEAVIIEIDDKTYAVPLDTVKAFEISDEVKAELEGGGDDDVSGFGTRYIPVRGYGSGELDFPDNYVTPVPTGPIRIRR